MPFFVTFGKKQNTSIFPLLLTAIELYQFSAFIEIIIELSPFWHWFQNVKMIDRINKGTFNPSLSWNKNRIVT